MIMNFKATNIFKTLLGNKKIDEQFPGDFEEFHISVIKKVKPFTMTSNERLYGLIEGVKYVIANNLPGSFVECGVWKGGSMMAIAETLLKLGISDRNLYLYDTFSGMTAPTKEDNNYQEQTAAELLIKDTKNKEESLVWAYSSLEEVKSNIARIGYPSSHIHFVEGDVLKTIPAAETGEIALLRLDTDWYESTKHELQHLYPKLVNKGVLIIDDYGFWKGSRKATDEYFIENKISILLQRMDDTGRCAIKVT